MSRKFARLRMIAEVASKSVQLHATCRIAQSVAQFTIVPLWLALQRLDMGHRFTAIHVLSKMCPIVYLVAAIQCSAGKESVRKGTCELMPKESMHLTFWCTSSQAKEPGKWSTQQMDPEFDSKRAQWLRGF